MSTSLEIGDFFFFFLGGWEKEIFGVVTVAKDKVHDGPLFRYHTIG